MAHDNTEPVVPVAAVSRVLPTEDEVDALLTGTDALTEERIATLAADKLLAKEAERWRRQTRVLTREIEELKRAKPAPDPGEAAPSPEELAERIDTDRQNARALAAALDSYSTDRGAALKILKADGIVIEFEGGAPKFRIDSELVDVDRAGLSRVLPGALVRSEQHKGSGSRAGEDGTGVRLESIEVLREQARGGNVAAFKKLGATGAERLRRARGGA